MWSFLTLLDSARAAVEIICRVQPEVLVVIKALTEPPSAPFSLNFSASTATASYLSLSLSSIFWLSTASPFKTPTGGQYATLDEEDEVCLSSLMLDFLFLLQGPAEKSPFEAHQKKLHSTLCYKWWNLF